MTEEKASPFAKAALTMALVSCCVTVLMGLSFLVCISGVEAAVWVLLGGTYVVAWVLAPLTLLVILIGIIHKLMTKSALTAWRRLGLAFFLGCVSVVGAFLVLSGLVVG